MEINQELRAALAWDVLIKIAKERSIIRYYELAVQIHISHHRPIRFFLGYIQDYCLEVKIPPLTILVVNQSGLPGSGFIGWDASNLEEGYKQVYDFNWSNIYNPFSYALKGYKEDLIIDELIRTPTASKEMYSLIKVRGIVQRVFRAALMRLYNSRCAFCSLGFEEALEAAHLIPWADSTAEQKLDVRNGILLCANHHRLFDAGWITVSEDFRFCYSDPEKAYPDYSLSDEFHTVNLHNKSITLPALTKHWPLPEYIRDSIEYRKVK